MKTYLKILGILSSIIVLGLFVILIIFTVEEEEWLDSFLLLIPIYVLSSYIIHTKLGFRQDKPSKLPLILSIMTFILVGVAPLSIYISQKKIADKYIEHTDWGTDTTVHNIKCQLKTRLKDDKIDYIFRANFGDKDYDINSFIICFYDSVGFQLHEFEIKDWTNIVDNNSNRIGISATSSKYFSDSPKEYGQFHNFDVKIRENK